MRFLRTASVLVMYRMPVQGDRDISNWSERECVKSGPSKVVAEERRPENQNLSLQS